MKLRDNTLKLAAAFALMLTLGAASGCTGLFGPHVPKRDCPVTSLLLVATDYPARLSPEAGEISSPVLDHVPESAWVDVGYAGQLATSTVDRRQSTALARRTFPSEKRRWFHTSEKSGYGPWERPQDLTYQSQVADEYYAACGPVLRKYRCRMVARYEEYLVELFADVSETGPDGGLTVDEFNGLLPVIDQRMADCLSKDPQP